MPFQSGFEHIVREGELLAPYTWLRLGGAAQYFAEPTNLDELIGLVRRCRERDVPVRLLGSGSNLLIRAEGVPGLVIHLTSAEFAAVSVQDGIITVGGGAKLSHLIASAVREGLGGLEQLVGIPGSVGGALHGNVSCHGTDIGQCTRSATVLTHAGEVVSHQREELVFAYRESSLDELVILDARFELEPMDADELTKRMQKQWIVNKAAQPLQNENTAMIFRDPGGISAATLIEEAGLKSARVGGAEISDRNANYIVSQREATSSDVLALIEYLRERVAERLGVELQTAIDVW
ncbi:MAG: UDP-N-acetylmuramate dehydrogenase [Planctomycetes bacterium]|nr:UDP-N-acetylmuramate dehydrogenase [Planctomycetota bacterium]